MPSIFLLDSASVADVRAARGLGYVAGMTTNPALIVAECEDALAHLQLLLEESSWPVFFQPLSSDPGLAGQEVRAARDLRPDRVVIKLPASGGFVALAGALVEEGASVALTAVYSASQALVAHGAGCEFVIPYVDRAARLDPTAGTIVERLSLALGAADSEARIVAASIKSSTQAASAILSGAHAVTMPLSVLRELPEHDLSRSAIDDFDESVAKSRQAAAGSQGLLAGARDRSL